VVGPGLVALLRLLHRGAQAGGGGGHGRQTLLRLGLIGRAPPHERL
jgi:hypothetical protein